MFRKNVVLSFFLLSCTLTLSAKEFDVTCHEKLRKRASKNFQWGFLIYSAPVYWPKIKGTIRAANLYREARLNEKVDPQKYTPEMNEYYEKFMRFYPFSELSKMDFTKGIAAANKHVDVKDLGYKFCPHKRYNMTRKVVFEILFPGGKIDPDLQRLVDLERDSTGAD